MLIDLRDPLIGGFGTTGQAMAKALSKRGFSATVLEDSLTEEKQQIAAEFGVKILDPAKIDEGGRELFSSASVYFPSPGMPESHQSFSLASHFTVPVHSEFDLVSMWDDRPLLAVTGTNGKTTVVTLLSEVFNVSGRKTEACGNVGLPLVEIIDSPEYEFFVVEASSFQLSHSQIFSPTIAAWLNFTPDHLDAHSSLASYFDAKASIWSRNQESLIAVANADDAEVLAAVPIEARRVTFSSDSDSDSSEKADWYVAEGKIIGPAGVLLQIDDLKRSQPTDISNYLAIAAVASSFDVSYEDVARVLLNFSGLEHRVEFVGSWQGVSWWNDSKATVPHATLAAVKGFDSVVLLAGGRNKGVSLSLLQETVPKVHSVVALGDAAEEVHAVFDNKVPVVSASSMEDAVMKAASLASAGDTVLLSPACTSYDWYKNYGIRGDDFKRIVYEKFKGSE